MTVDAEFAEVTREFLAEGLEILDRIEDAAIALEERPSDMEVVRSLFRGAHTLKGNASCLSLANMTRAAHEMEDVMDLLRGQSAVADPQLVTLILQMVDAFREALPGAVDGRDDMPARTEATLAELQTWAKRRRMAAPGDDSTRERSGSQGTIRRAAAAQLHVETERLDQLVSLVGELAIGRGRLARELEHSGAAAAALEAFGETEHLSQQIQDLATRLRMVRVGTVFRPLVRTVRDLAAAEGKKARITIEGGDVEVDLSIVEHLRDPLMHMVRNAIGHGIEKPDVRVARGKPAEGRITLRARHEAGSIVIELHDDGQGFDRRMLAQRAAERGLDTAKLGDRDLVRLVLEPGFSTARAVSEISGRGVGLDVVRRNVESLRGSIDIADRNGAQFTLRLPLTLAIIEGFGVSVGDEAFIIPLVSVLECLDIRERALDARDGMAVIDLRGKPLPVIDLGTRLGKGHDTPAHHVVVIESAGGRAGLAVDRLEGLHQSVIKPLGRVFAHLRDFSGSSILSDGRVALVLDVAALVERAVLQSLKEKVSCE